MKAALLSLGNTFRYLSLIIEHLAQRKAATHFDFTNE